jgi:hypothetical protein
MRNLVAAALSLSLFASSALAAGEATLAPGKPAGVKQAQDTGINTTALIVITGIVAAGVAIGVSTAADGNPPNRVGSTVLTSAP